MPRSVARALPASLAPLVAILAAPLLGACASAEPYVLPADLKSPYTGYSSPRYQDPARWVCRPDIHGSPCERDRTATEIRADGSRVAVPSASAEAPEVDCFYVYPTVDLSLGAGNHDDFSDTRKMADVTFAQAASFSEACAVYAPLYRQITIGTYLRREAVRERGLEVAFSDVADAFLHYMGQHNRGRPIVLLGHSQGAEMVVRLLKRFFDADPALRERLLVAMPIGGHVEVAEGQKVGGTFANLPLCTSAEQRGCVVAYRSYRGYEEAGHLPADKPSPGREIACVNPADVGGNARRALSRTLLPLSEGMRDTIGPALSGMEDVKTPMLLLRGFYSAQCMAGEEGIRYLGVWPSSEPGDVRAKPFDLSGFRFGTDFGLHVLDYQLPLGDLVDLVKRRAPPPAEGLPPSKAPVPAPAVEQPASPPPK